MRIVAAALILIAAVALPVGEASASAQDCDFWTPLGCVDPFLTAAPAEVAPGGKVTVTALIRCDGDDVPRATSSAFTAPVTLPTKVSLRYFNAFQGIATVSSNAKAGVTSVTATCSGKHSVTGTLKVLPGKQVPGKPKTPAQGTPKPKTPSQVTPKPKGAVQTGGGGTARQ
jgi:hypothetical protein